MDTNLIEPALNTGMLHLDSSALWAGLFWSGVGGGYMVYGWKQKAGIPLAGGVAMTLACFFSVLPMTLISIASMVGVYWLMKRAD